MLDEQLALLVAIAEVAKKTTQDGYLRVATNGAKAVMEYVTILEMYDEKCSPDLINMITATDPATEIWICLEGQFTHRNKKELIEEAQDFQSILLKRKKAKQN